MACIADVLQFLGVDDDETALSVMNNAYHGETEEYKEPIEWDQEKLKDMSREELWKVFNDWTENSWEHMSDRSYYIDANSQMIQP